KGFGQVKLTLKDSVRSRTTVTYGDSNYIGVPDGDALPSPIDDPSELSVVPWHAMLPVLKPVVERGDRPLPLPRFTPEQQRTLAAEHGAKWTVRPGSDFFGGSGEIVTPPLGTQGDYFGALHELAHAALHAPYHDWSEDREMLREVESWRWALDQAGEPPDEAT